uniref:C2H2-type domain-containing protein n=1 Tax=Photinus pyralis TaxID=7054 RepID=A0A1Y1MFK0_PHOPY
MSATVKAEVEQEDELDTLPDERVLFNNDIFGIIKQESDESSAKVTRYWEDQDASQDSSRAQRPQVSVDDAIDHQLELRTHKIFKCDQCNYTSGQKSILRKHMLTHTGMKMSKGTQCDFVTSVIKHQSTPRPTHSTTFDCATCHYTTKIAWNFRKHLLTHKTIIPKIAIASNYQPNFTKYNCTTCDYRTNVEWDFKLHLITHKTILPKI